MTAETRRKAEIEMDRLKAELDNLHPIIWRNGRKISFKGFLSMLDAAMLNYYTRNVSHWRCVFCFLLPREFRLIQAGDYQLNEKALDTLCLSILHFPLRMGDHLLKVSYSQNGIFGVCKSPKQRIKFLKIFCPLKWNKKKI